MTGALARPVSQPRRSDWVAAALFCASVASVLAVVSPGCRHWFAVPAVLCGIVLAADVASWLRRGHDALDPVALVGVLGLHFFFFAPFIQATAGFYMEHWTEHWATSIDHPQDWRPWFGAVLLLTLPGLAAYRAVVWWISERPVPGPMLPRLPLDTSLFRTLLGGAMLLSAALQVWIYALFGGIEAYSDWVRLHGARAFTGQFGLFLAAESLPMLASVAYSEWASRRPRLASFPAIALFLLAILAASLFFGGLRGSRSLVIFNLFWAVGLIHFRVRPVSVRVVALGLLFMILFMYSYGFYKWSRASGGLKGSKHQTSLLRTLVFDLGRVNVQAYVLLKLKQAQDYDYGHGGTYLGALALVVPSALWEDRPYTKRKYGTDLLFGRGQFARGRIRSNLIYGLGGEAMLNFGPWGLPFVFPVWGAFVGWARRQMAALDSRDHRWILAPLAVTLSLALLAFDSTNVLVLALKSWSIPMIILAVSAGFARVEERS